MPFGFAVRCAEHFLRGSKERMSTMEAMFREFASRHAEDAPKPPVFISPAMRDEAAFYERHVPFAVGNLVTPRKGSTVNGAGNALIVIEVNEAAEPNLSLGEIGSRPHGNRFDMQVLAWRAGRFAVSWVESAEFEAWIDPHADAAAPAAGAEAPVA